jgi:hypothetical protein
MFNKEKQVTLNSHTFLDYFSLLRIILKTGFTYLYIKAWIHNNVSKERGTRQKKNSSEKPELKCRIIGMGFMNA